MDSSDAESIFADFLNRRDQGENLDIDTLCSEYPHQAEDVRKLHAEWATLQSAMSAEPENSPLAEGSVYTSGESAEDVAWQQFIGQLRSHRPAQSRYVLRGELAKGGMGVIYTVYDTDVRRQLAMKVVLGRGEVTQGGMAPDVDSRSLGRFLEEAQVTGQLDHPGIVPVHELGVDENDQVFFTMKLVKGEDLSCVFDRVHDPNDDAWNPTRALSLLLRVCEAMAYAHSKGVIHRDLKPSNIMVGKFGETYVMDWGLARVLGREDQKNIRIQPTNQRFSTIVQSQRKDPSATTPDSPLITMDGDVVGTPAYMSPEQARGELDKIGPQSDVYALGAMLYHLLTGHMPYVQPGIVANQHAIWRWVQEGPPLSLRKVAREAPEELVAICEKAMSRMHSDRYQDMEAVGVDLRNYLEHRVVAAYESGPIAELKKWIQRNPGITKTAAAAILIIFAMTTWYVLAVTAKEREARANERHALSRKAEFDQLAGVILLEDALAAEKELYPAWPQNSGAMESWFTEYASRLSLLKPTLMRTLSDLEARAWPSTTANITPNQNLHPRTQELIQLRLFMDFMRRAQAVSQGLAVAEFVRLPEALLTADAKALNDYSWPRVFGDVSNRLFGEEREALAAARAALSLFESGDRSVQQPWLMVTLAWALFANGLHAEAKQAIEMAVAAAPAEVKLKYLAYQEQLEETVAAWEDDGAEQQIETLEAELAALESEVAQSDTWHFSEEQQRFLHNTLSDLLRNIEAFEATLANQVEERLEWSRRVEELTLNHPNAIVSWEEAREAIAAADDVTASSLYRSHPTDLKPQLGLVPIGMNPVTQLFEFYHLRTAYDPSLDMDPGELAIPEHREDGSLEIKADSGLVFVLIPGGTYLIGAQSTDPEGPHYDPQAQPSEAPVYQVELDPYFLSRYEMTQGQWERIAGENPSNYGPHKRNAEWNVSGQKADRTHPVENISSVACMIQLGRLGLRLPSEAQWEAACRAGSKTPWWTGVDVRVLDQVANLADQYGAKHGHESWSLWEQELNDGNTIHARVGSYRANPFGLHDTIGNVWEWCLDGYTRYDEPGRIGDGARLSFADTNGRVTRGGCFGNTANFARSSFRNNSGPEGLYVILGCRPARDVQFD